MGTGALAAKLLSAAARMPSARVAAIAAWSGAEAYTGARAPTAVPVLMGVQHNG